ncbi:hypothetical protein KZJ38_21450 [Paraburkholderia edwinii]|uniref:Phage tail-like protein n=1 Tax=Paraburkholderia edwinii TaxID=2861782 RepID=A0ABX8UP36_9BURK|nr:hypothetical protein [Paraburkholderia edwinii]QYD68754.1 hypothetical protein KZJ38_21450 [Paraburkholderia edwinii]
MLLTDATWAEFHPVRRALVQPYSAWRCVGWVNETTNFWVIPTGDLEEREGLPDGWFVSGGEALLNMAGQLDACKLAVYAIEMGRRGAGQLVEVTALWSELANPGIAVAFWYGIPGGKVRACNRTRAETDVHAGLVQEIAFGGCAKTTAAL